MSKTQSMVDISAHKPPQTASAKVIPLDSSVFDDLVDYDRDEIINKVQKLLANTLMGNISLPPSQQKALEYLGKKYIENPPTVKEESDPIDFLQLLSESYQANKESSLYLEARAKEFYAIEKERDEALHITILEVEEEEAISKHIPEGLNVPVSEIESSGVDFPAPENNRFDEIPLFQGDGVLPAQTPTWVPHPSS